MATEKFVAANGLRLHYLDYNDDAASAKPPLMCVHGLTGNAHNFDALAPHLTASYHVMSLDVRGRGDSEWGGPMDYTVPCYVSDLAAVLEQVGGSRKITLIGTSMGGIISIAFAGGYPDRVGKMVINDIGPDIDPAGAKRIGSYVGEAPAEFASLSEVAGYYRATYPPFAKLTEAAANEFVKWAVKPSPNGRLTWKMDPAVRRATRAGGAAARLPDLWMQYARITAPILVVRGGDSDVLSPTTVNRMCTVLPGVPVSAVEVPGVGHAPSLAEPAALSAIREFLGVAA
jgi:pimeloyl-ACP methyl ester carboxylesterase